jgi:anti-anti-sigma regulatory factor
MIRRSKFRITSCAIEWGVRVVEVGGPLGAAAAPSLKQHLLVGCDKPGTCTILVLDEAKLEDAVPLGVMLAATKRQRSIGGDIHLVVGDGPMALVADTFGFNELFTIWPSLSEAVAELAPVPAFAGLDL